jgi:hypothetical protein
MEKDEFANKEPYNNQNAGELLIVAFFESGFGSHHSGDCW